MKVKSINLTVYLSTTYLDPSPTRYRTDEPPLAERRIPLIYSCEDCGLEINIDESDMQKHYNSAFSNLTDNDNSLFQRYGDDQGMTIHSFLDFYCPKCKQATKILFDGGISGRGEFGFTIDSVLVLKSA
jgi:DNA-directed RNA polymerase subunit M/transcription elongation factor TFIIS